MIIEICAANIQSALAAQRSGAHRIELCSGLESGGLTPSYGLINAAVEHLSIPVCVLIRPRDGNFCYDANELAIMLDDIRFCRDIGAAGVVIGALTPDGQYDMAAMEAMRDAAGDMEVVSHRAFDYTKNPAASLEKLIDLGCCRVLSSGQAVTAFEGRFLLKEMVEKAAGRITVMPGAGISIKNVREIATVTGATELHMTARKRVEQPTDAAIPGLEWGYWASDDHKIREILEALLVD